MAVATQMRRIENNDNGTTVAAQESENARDVRMEVLADELDGLANFIEQHVKPQLTNTSNDDYLTYGGITLKGKIDELLHAEGSLNLFTGATLNLNTATLRGNKRFLHEKTALGEGGTLTLIPKDLKAGVEFPLDELEIKSKDISGKAQLAQTVKLGASPRIEAKKFILHKDKIEVPNARLLNDTDEANHIPASDKPLSGVVITKDGIRAKKNSAAHMTTILNEGLQREQDGHVENPVVEEVAPAEEAQEMAQVAAQEPDALVVADAPRNHVVIPPKHKKITMHVGGPGNDKKYFTKMHIDHVKDDLYNIDLFQEKSLGPDNMLRLRNVKKLPDGSYSLQDKEVAFRTDSVCLFPYFLHLKGITIKNNDIMVAQYKKTIYRDKYPIVGHHFAPRASYDFTTLTKEKLTDLWNQQLCCSVVDNSAVATNNTFNTPKNLPLDMGTALMPFGATAAARLRYYLTFGLFSVVVGLESAAAFTYGFDVTKNRIGFDVTNLELIAGEKEAITNSIIYGNASASVSAKIGLTAGVATLATIEAGLRALMALNTRVNLGTAFHTRKGKVTAIDIFGNASMNLLARLERYTQFNFLIWSRSLHQRTIAECPMGNANLDIRFTKDLENHKPITPEITGALTLFNHDIHSKVTDKEAMGNFLNKNKAIKNQFDAGENNFQGIIDEIKEVKELLDNLERPAENTSVEIKNEGVENLVEKLRNVHYKFYLHTKGSKKLKKKINSQKEDINLLRINEKLNIQIATLNTYMNTLNGFDPFIEQTKQTIGTAQSPYIAGNEATLKNIKDKCVEINRFRDQMSRDGIITVFFTHRLRMQHSHGKSAEKKHKKATKELEKINTKYDEEYGKKAFAYATENNLNEEVQSSDLYKRYATKRNFFRILKPTEEIKKYYPSLPQSQAVAQKHLNTHIKKVQSKRGLKHTLRNSKLQNSYLKLSAEDRKKPNKAFYKLYTSTTKVFDPRGIRKTLIGYSTRNHFRKFAEYSLTSDIGDFDSQKYLSNRNKFIALRKQYEEAKKATNTEVENQAPEVKEVLKINLDTAAKALNQHARMVQKDVGTFTHRYMTSDDFVQLRKQISLSDQIAVTAAKGSRAKTRSERNESSVKQQVMNRLLTNEDGLAPLLAYERHQGNNLSRAEQIALLTRYQKQFKTASSPAERRSTIKTALNEYFSILGRHSYINTILDGNTQFLTSSKNIQSIDYEGKSDLGQGTAYDQMHKYGKKGNFFVSRSNKNKMLSQTYMQQTKLTADHIEAYYEYMLSKTRFYDYSHTKDANLASHIKLAKQHGLVMQLYKQLDSGGENEYSKVKDSLDRAENRNIQRRFQNYLISNIDALMTPDRIVDHEKSRLNYYYNDLYRDEKALLDQNHVKEFLDTDVVKEFYKDMIFDNDNTMSLRNLRTFQDLDKGAAVNEQVDKINAAKQLADSYAEKGFTTDKHISLGRWDYNAFEYLLAKVSLSKDLVNNELKIKHDSHDKLTQSYTGLDVQNDKLQKQIALYGEVDESLTAVADDHKKILEPGFFNNNIYAKLVPQLEVMEELEADAPDNAADEPNREALAQQITAELA